MVFFPFKQAKIEQKSQHWMEFDVWLLVAWKCQPKEENCQLFLHLIHASFENLLVLLIEKLRWNRRWMSHCWCNATELPIISMYVISYCIMATEMNDGIQCVCGT